MPLRACWCVVVGDVACVDHLVFEFGVFVMLCSQVGVGAAAASIALLSCEFIMYVQIYTSIVRVEDLMMSCVFQLDKTL